MGPGISGVDVDTGVEIALIVTCGTFAGIVGNAISQTVLSRLAGAQRHTERAEDRAEREEDRKRRDDVAERAEEATRRASDVATILAQNTKKVADRADALLESNVNIEKKVDAVTEIAVTTHGLVNSALTEVKQSNLDGLRRELVLMIQLGSSRDEIELQESKITDAQNELAERSKTAALVDKMMSKAED